MSNLALSVCNNGNGLPCYHRAHPEMKALLGIDRDPVAHSIAQHTLQAAAAGRDPALDIMQIQV